MVRKLVMVAIGLAVLVVTPYFLFDLFGRGDRDSGFQFGAAEMRSAVEGTWVAKLTPAGGPERSITFTIEQAGPAAHSSREGGWIRPAAACEHRTLVRSAEACIDTSDMALELVAIEGAPSSARHGTFSVRGKKFETGHLRLTLDGNALEAYVARTGEVLSIQVMALVELPRGDAPGAQEPFAKIARSVSLTRIRPR
jgi:hypothetical protein